LIIKKNIDYQTAVKYKSAFEKNGAICEIEEISEQKQSGSDKKLRFDNKSKTIEQNNSVGNKWKCPICDHENEMDMIRCICGFENLVYDKHDDNKKTIISEKVSQTQQSDSVEENSSDATGKWGRTIAGAICYAIVRYGFYKGGNPGFFIGVLSFVIGSCVFEGIYLLVKNQDSGSGKSEKNNTAISSAASAIETHLQQHLANMKLTYSARKSISTVTLLWNKLLRPDILSFTINTIDQELRKSIDDKTHHFRCKEFNDIYLCVSTVPCSDLKRAGSFFNGYLNFLNSVVYKANFQPGNSQDFDLAHWIFCYGAENRDARASVHLSFFPGNKIAFAVLAQDLMTPEEKLKAGL